MNTFKKCLSSVLTKLSDLQKVDIELIELILFKEFLDDYCDCFSVPTSTEIYTFSSCALFSLYVGDNAGPANFVVCCMK